MTDDSVLITATAFMTLTAADVARMIKTQESSFTGEKYKEGAFCPPRFYQAAT
jgi:hypothetical protein